ncbi:MAG: GUN4 domain-containing protein [Pleurocapsa sp. MO_226.B13]|nr:GUN4 domain-containing protein [Pleurocapsa sp. MO_226.B13]
MGKSSLWVRVKQRLEREDYICAAIDLSGIGQGDKQEWYTSFANRLVKSFAPAVKKKWRLWRKDQVKAFVYLQAGQFQFSDKKKDSQKYYQLAYDALKESNFDPYINVGTDVLNERDVEQIHYQLIKSHHIDINSESNEIATSFRKHLYDGLKFLLTKENQDNLREADRKTREIMLYLAQRYEEGFFSPESLENFSCPALRQLDALWYNYPFKHQHFGFRVQREIWQEVGSPDENSPIENWRKFYIKVEWKTEESGIKLDEGWVEKANLGGFKDLENSKRGNLPQWMGVSIENSIEYSFLRVFFSRAANCNL